MQILANHTSPDTAYTVDDYPYGFRLRCKIRYWLDYSPSRGVRLMSQTSNPKQPGLVWNKPKASTYCRFAGTMFLDDDGHVQWSGLHEYMDTAQTLEWRDTYGIGCHPDSVATMSRWVDAKVAYEARKAPLP